MPTAFHAGAISIRVEVAPELGASIIWHVRLLTWTVSQMVHAQGASAWQVMQLPPSEEIGIAGAVPPSRAKKVRYYEHRPFAERWSSRPIRPAVSDPPETITGQVPSRSRPTALFRPKRREQIRQRQERLLREPNLPATSSDAHATFLAVPDQLNTNSIWMLWSFPEGHKQICH